MYYNGKENTLAEFIEAKKQEWFERDRKRGHDEAYITKYWNDEGIVWAVQDYYGSMGEFSEADIETIKEHFGQWAGDVIDLCEEAG